MTFFELAKALGGTPAVAGVREVFLVSISLGSVFCGAMTYIGNGPNFMVKAIAESDGVEMPSFGGYVARYALVYLAPILALMRRDLHRGDDGDPDRERRPRGLLAAWCVTERRWRSAADAARRRTPVLRFLDR